MLPGIINQLGKLSWFLFPSFEIIRFIPFCSQI